MFKRNTQLASYLVAQIGVLCKMASGRSYNVIDWLTRTFSYEMLVSMASNYYLPYQITQGACNLVRVLYLDRYPQLPFSGRAILPEVLWIYEVVRKDVDKTAIPVLRPISLSEAGSLPGFKIAPSHKLHGTCEFSDAFNADSFAETRMQ